MSIRNFLIFLFLFSNAAITHTMKPESPYNSNWTYQNDDINNTHQPVIKAFAWGMLIIEDTQGQEHTFGGKSGERGDIRLWPGGFDAWDWRKTKTQHTPGVQPDDFKDLMNNTIAYLILTKGVEGVLQTNSKPLSEYLETLKKENPKLHVLKLLTPDAIEKYNSLVREGKKVIGIFHTTC